MPAADQTSLAILPSGPFRIAQTDVDLRAGLLSRDGREERLEPRLAGVLALLVQHAPEPVTRDMFLDMVWDGEGSDEALTQAISRLRRIFGDATAIKTHPRIGYSLAAPLDAAGSAVLVAETPSPEALRGLARRFGTWPVGIAAAAISALILTGFLAGRLWPPAPGEQEFIPFDREIEFVQQPADGELVTEVVREGADGEPVVERVRQGSDGELEVEMVPLDTADVPDDGTAPQDG